MKRKLIVGTRGSKMALAQTGLVADALRSQYPDVTIETKVITTKGDKNMAPIPLDSVGKDWFTKEIEVALAAGEIDFAVHSFKDLAPVQPEGLIVQPVFKRSDPRDVLVSGRQELQLQDLPEGAVIGTDSLRRKANLLIQRPDLVVRSLRGNVQTRLQKLADEDYDAIVLAAAGLERLNELDRVSEYFEPDAFVPAIGQGVLAVETRIADTELRDMIETLQDEPTLQAVAAEQKFSAVIGGGCKLPVGCYAELNGDTVTIHGMLGSDDATQAVIRSTSGAVADAVRLAEELAATLQRELK